ncbi:chromosome partitioning protein [Bradyrhizobium sp. JR4.1]|uniref:ParA family protein n=1 Tax=Bradyrhizobium sp. JR4.1 TaxID=3156372 RepID=UPI0033938E13
MSKPVKKAPTKPAPKQPVVISCVNLKGGVGKTAIAVNFAAHCGRKGLRTLLIDLDPQTNATFSCISVPDWEKHATAHGTVANLLGVRQHTSAEGKLKTAQDVIIKSVFKNVDLIPSHLDLFTIDLDLSSEVARETRLRRAIKDVLGNYDVVVCDCPPNLTIPTQNALAISTHYVVPVSLDFLSSLGIALLLTRIAKLSQDLENPLVHAGIIISRVGRTSFFRTQTAQTLQALFPGMVFSTQISERTSVAESAAKNCSIFGMPDNTAIGEFTALGDELLAKLKTK